MVIAFLTLVFSNNSLHAQRTATATATVMYGFVVDIAVTDGGAGYFVPPTVTITEGGGSGATAVASISNGAVTEIIVLSTGGGYTSTPNIVIELPPTPRTIGPPAMALQIAPMLIVSGEPGSTASVSYAEAATPTQWVVITNVVLRTNDFVWCDPVARPGQRRYEAVAVPPNPSPNPRTAVGTTIVYRGFVVAVVLTDGGEGYISPPSVTFLGSGSGAAAVAAISNGVVTHVTVNQTGSGYTSADVLLSAPARITRLTEFRVPKVTMFGEPSTTAPLLSSETPDKTNAWAHRTSLLLSSNECIWFDLTATQAVSRFYKSLAPMAIIPAGSFAMGDSLDGDTSALPLHDVYVSAFYIDRYKVSKALWDEVYEWALMHGYSFGLGSGPGKAENHPIWYIYWCDAVKWCNARSEKEGRVPAYYTDAGQSNVYRIGETNVQNGWVKWNTGYRLPTEAEWEKAARGGLSGLRFPWGNTISWNQANYAANPVAYAFDLNPTTGRNPAFNDGENPKTSPVGYFAPNEYGLYDLAGNVWEWCWDWYGAYSNGMQTDPRGPPIGSIRVFRGGYWAGSAYYCRAANRYYEFVSTGPGAWFAFRCVLSPGQ